MRARSDQRRVRLVVALVFCVGAFVGCKPPPSEAPAHKPANVAWMPGSDGADKDEDEDRHAAICEDDPEAPGCPWDRNAINTGPEGVWGNSNPNSGALPEPVEPERCPASTVLGDMIEIPAGAFVMGCDDPDTKICGQLERERVRVELPAFAIDRTEVTQAAYQLCVEAGSCTVPAGGFEPRAACIHPVVNVSWKQAGQYCAWVDKRLPTEAEWEKAARGTDERIYPWGDGAPTCALANFAGCGLRAAEAVASHPTGASPYGVLDLAGNVREWVFDREQGHAGQPKRGIRGGMFTDAAMNIRAARRQWGDVSVSDLGIGFRCAR